MFESIKIAYYILKYNFKYFKYNQKQKADFLKKHSLYEKAGDYYSLCEEYKSAIYCYQKSKCYIKLIKTYERAGFISDAIYACERYQFYKLGASICKSHSMPLKQHYFIAYFNPLLAARYYKKQHYFLEAMICYLRAGNLTYALDTIMRCQDPIHYRLGISYLSELGVSMYFSKNYKDALKLFLKIFDYNSALQCAKKMNNDFIIGEVFMLLANQEYLQGNIQLANIYKTSALQYTPHTEILPSSNYA